MSLSGEGLGVSLLAETGVPAQPAIDKLGPPPELTFLIVTYYWKKKKRKGKKKRKETGNTQLYLWGKY